jgi:hypothetical protein
VSVGDCDALAARAERPQSTPESVWWWMALCDGVRSRGTGWLRARAFVDRLRRVVMGWAAGALDEPGAGERGLGVAVEALAGLDAQRTAVDVGLEERGVAAQLDVGGELASPCASFRWKSREAPSSTSTVASEIALETPMLAPERSACSPEKA